MYDQYQIRVATGEEKNVSLKEDYWCKPFRGDQYQIRVAPWEEKNVLLKEDYWADSIGHSLSSSSRFEWNGIYFLYK